MSDVLILVIDDFADHPFDAEHASCGLEDREPKTALAERHGLRAYDAVHLASVDAVADEETLLVAADGAIVRAARAHGIATSAL